MFSKRLYYGIKPVIPWRVRIALRRWMARRRIPLLKQAWPIQPGTERPPAGWPGWPGGKQFCFVLTHDVEHAEGYEKVRRLAEIEQELGFRSAFNFIPKGGYQVGQATREWLTGRGFEVGVHDLYHDGKMYDSEQRFREHARLINRFLADWNAVGFRSGFMLHRLDWLHHLNIQYDSSTFDTDPFEPQSDGVGSIFPFWVSGPEERGYVELPYTLPQDSTLFLVLQERGVGIWTRKLEWLAKHGGLALLNVHPDYVCLPDAQPRPWEFPVQWYIDFLKHVRQRYGDACWHPLPREVAEFTRDTAVDASPKAAPVPRRCGMVRSSAVSHRLVWIDLDNTPHVPFFDPIIDELRMKGYPVLVTARDAYQVCELAEEMGVGFVKVGRHYGRNWAMKASGTFYRVLQLASTILPQRPAIAVSHGSRSQVIFCNLMRIPTVMIEDYEHASFPWIAGPDWVVTPSVIPADRVGRPIDRIRTYDGIKEDVYAWKLKPDPSILSQLGIHEGELVVTVRPPATEAHYHNPESELLFMRFMDRAISTPGVRVVLLPRNRRQATWIAQHWPSWFEGKKVIIPDTPVNGMNLIWHSDLVVSGGGTMNREAAALGVPVYSIFRGTIGAVDRQLSHENRLILIERPDDVQSKIKLERRPRRRLEESTSRKTLERIVGIITEICDRSA